MHALITGGAGFIGGHLSETLLAQGHQVTAVDNLSTGRYANVEALITNPNFRFVGESIINEMVMDRLIEQCDLVFHLAAVVGVDLVVKDPVRTVEINLHGTETVLRLARRYHKKVLIASTSEVYGKSESIPFREDSDRVMGPTTKSRWIYAESKAIDELLALAYHKQFELPIVICRLFNTVGLRQTGMYGMVIPRFVEQAVHGRPIRVFGDGTQSRCFCNVKDVTRALLGVMLEPKAVGEIFNVGSQEEITILNLARRVIARAESPSEISLVPYDEAYEKGFEDMQRRVPAIDKINTAIGWSPSIKLDQTLDEVIAYYRR